jgi:hypothetical protein
LFNSVKAKRVRIASPENSICYISSEDAQTPNSDTSVETGPQTQASRQTLRALPQQPKFVINKLKAAEEQIVADRAQMAMQRETDNARIDWVEEIVTELKEEQQLLQEQMKETK